MLTAIALPQNTIDSPATIKVKVNGFEVMDALADTGASVTVVNQQLVDQLKLPIQPYHGNSIVVANSSSMQVIGLVDLDIRLFGQSVRTYAFYVPDIMYQLIIGTNALKAFGISLTMNGKPVWLLVTPTASEASVNAVKAHCEGPPTFVRLVERVTLPPSSGIFVRGLINTDMDGNDVLLEPTKRKFKNGDVPRQLIRVLDKKHLQVFVTNTSPCHSLSLAPRTVLARASSGASHFENKQGEVLTIDLLERKHVSGDEEHATEDATEDRAETSGMREFPQKKLGRRSRRALARIQRDSSRRCARLNNVSVQPSAPSTVTESVLNSVKSPELSPDERKQVIDLLGEFKVLYTTDIRSTTPLIRHNIHVEDTPIKQRAYRLAHSEKPFVDQYITESLTSGIIRPSSSPWSSPILLVQKKDGTKRFCVDYRKLNSVTKKDVFPLPRLDDALECLDGMKYFSTIDLVQSYYQIEVSEEDREKTAFVTDRGLYEYNVMPFGLTNAPATFQHLMNLILQGISWQTSSTPACCFQTTS